MQDDLQLISKLKELKSISPRKEWVTLAKTQMFQAPTSPVLPQATFMGAVRTRFNGSPLFSRGLVYSFAALLIVVVGVYGMTKLPLSLHGGAKNPAALLAAQTSLENNVKLLETKSQDLAEASKSKTTDLSAPVKAVKEVAKNITDSIKKDPELASKVALDINNNKTYLDVAGGNNSAEVSDMYKTIVVQMIKDLDGTTLTKDQEAELARIKTSLAKDPDYPTALRDILLISRAGQGSQTK